MGTHRYDSVGDVEEEQCYRTMSARPTNPKTYTQNPEQLHPTLRTPGFREESNQPKCKLQPLNPKTTKPKRTFGLQGHAERCDFCDFGFGEFELGMEGLSMRMEGCNMKGLGLRA